MKQLIRAAVVAALALTALPAKADILWNWSWVFDTVRQGLPDLPSYGGTMTTNDGNGNGTYTITAITGMWGTVAIAELLPVGDFGSNSNLLYDVPPLLDGGGVSFLLATGVIDNVVKVNIWNGGAADVQAAQDCCGIYSAFESPETGGSGTFDVTPAPEPASLVLLAGGLAALGAARRRR